MLLVDTSVWIDHLNGQDASLVWYLEEGLVVTHPFVIGELACGNMRNRAQILASLQQLPALPAASDTEVLYFIEQQRLMGAGIGYIDAHLLAAMVIDGSNTLWTKDKRLHELATALGVAAKIDRTHSNVHEGATRYSV